MGRLTDTARRAGFSAMVLLGLAGAGRAEAQVGCGDVIRPNEKVTLQGDVGNCGPGQAALTIIGPATLDLNGFSVTCTPADNDRATGIVVVGKRATVRNGTVQLCRNGVEVLGEGSHRIEGIIAATSDRGLTGDGGDGFRVESDGNRLTGNTAVQNASIGFSVSDSERNRLTDNNAFFNGGIGFAISAGGRNVLRGNRALDGGSDGFRLSRGTRNSLTENTATGNDVGFALSDEVATRLTANLATANREDGISLFFGRGNRLVRNRAEDNDEHGIVVAAATQTVITRNTALNNDQGDNQDPRFDLLDFGEPNCGTNRWLANTFVTSNPSSCIR